MAQLYARDTSSTQRHNLLRVRYRARWTPLSRIGTVDTSPEPGAINAEDAKEVIVKDATEEQLRRMHRPLRAGSGAAFFVREHLTANPGQEDDGPVLASDYY